MTVQSIQSSPTLQNFSDPVDLDQKIKRAIADYDMPAIKELISKGASGDQRVFLNYSSIENIFFCIKDRAYLQKILEILYIDAEDFGLKEKYLEDFDKLSEWINEGGPLSERFVLLISKLWREINTFELTEVKIDEMNNEISLFEFAVLAKDLELVNLLLDSGINPNIKEFSEISFFSPTEFTETCLLIVNSLLDRGFSVDDLLRKFETYDSILSNAKRQKNELLLSFLKKHEDSFSTQRSFPLLGGNLYEKV